MPDRLLLTTAIALTALAGPGLALAIAAAAPTRGGPLVLVTAPWGPTAAAVIAAADGPILHLGQNGRTGQTVLAGDDAAERLRAAGAFLVLDAGRLAALCR